MPENLFAKNLLIESRKRLVGSLMSYLEAEIYPLLPSKVDRDDLRQKVLNSIGAYHDVCLDLLKSSINDGSVTNDLVLQAIYDLHDEMKRWE